jgi:uncharacterized protein YdaU (DUF1376 family)
MLGKKPGTRTLKEIELEVLAEGREWMRRRLEEELQKEAERDGRVFPPQRQKRQAPPQRKADDQDRGRRS